MPVILGRHQENCGLKPTQANSLQDPISKTSSQKGLVEWLKVEGVEFKPQYHQKKKKKKKKTSGAKKINTA
jgi:hypothetical protein